MNKLAPIVIFVYNREEELIKTVESLKLNYLAEESELYIFSDGPKRNTDEVKIQRVQEYILTIEKFKKINIIKHNVNKGLANSIIDGVTEIIEKHGKVIVLEDDLITSPNFLEFMNHALLFYEHDPGVLSVSGYTLDLKSLSNSKDYYFGYRASSWGWGTWKEQWEKIDWTVSDYEKFITNRSLRKQFNRGGSDMSKMLQRQQEGKNDSWAIRFCYHQFKHDLKTVFPTTSKVQSIGFSKEATHTVGTKRFITPLDEGSKRVFKFEKFEQMDDQLVKEFQNKFSFKARAIDKIRRIFEI